MGAMVVVENDTIRDAVAVTPSDTVPVSARYNHAFMATGAGNIVFKFLSGNTLTLAFAAGEIVKIHPEFVMATSTTATGIMGLKLYR